MWFIRFIAVSLLLIVGVSAQAETSRDEFALIRGKISTPVKDNKIELKKAVDGALSIHTITPVDEQGYFAFMVPVSSPGFYQIKYADYKQKQIVRLYLEPGLDLDLNIDENSYQVSGDNLGYNELVMKWSNQYQKFSKYITLGANVTYEDFYPFLESEGLLLGAKFIEGVDTGDKDFDELMKLAVRTDVEGACYRFFMLPRTKHPDKENYPKVYKDWKQENKFSNPLLLELGGGLDLVKSYFQFWNMKDGLLQPKPALDNAMKSIVPERLKEVFLFDQFSRYKTRKPPKAQYYDLVESVRQYMVSDKSKSLLVELEKEFHSQVGQPGFNFTYQDIDGNPVSFESFRGKVVYVDVWATWCAPCKAEIPHLKKLEKELHGKDVVFVSISTDMDEEAWREFQEENDMTGVQLLADDGPQSGISKTYEINSIPRFMLFDREGKVVDTNARRPSAPELKGELLDLINRQVQ
ncbi:TlpA disulfide reductase family protein [Porticoccaceae bacterium LTM1]|nr:TlpA disulfide reductase family protein [Porticoccaceae bacterium LTM1]